MTIEQFREGILGSVRSIGGGFTKPDDDWVPVLIIDNHVGRTAWPVGAFFASDDGKDKLIALLPTIFQNVHATRAALISSAWILDLPNTEEARRVLEQGKSIAEEPNRKEIVMIRLSDGFVEEGWLASITRDETKPPVLGQFEKMPDAGEGRMIGALQSALMHVRDKAASDLVKQ